MLGMLHDYLDAKGNKEFALGTEHFTDATAQQVDFVHNITGATGAYGFQRLGPLHLPGGRSSPTARFGTTRTSNAA